MYLPSQGQKGATFHDLPAEMLLRIAESIPSTETSTLHSLSAVDRRLHDIVEPFLYHHIQYDVQRHKPLHYLLRTLLERPQLALLVQCVEVLAWEDFDTFVRSYDTDEEELQVIRTSMMRKASEFDFGKQTTYWCKALYLGVDHAALALLLFITPNLHSAYLYNFVCTTDFWFVQLLSAAHSTPNRFPKELLHLKNLKLWTSPVEFTSVPSSGHTLSHGLSPFFSTLLPALSTLELHYGSSGIQPDLRAAHWASRTSSITTLILREIDFSPPLIETLLHACRALKTFEWHSTPFAPKEGVAVTDAAFQFISKALGAHKESLERLVLSYLPMHKVRAPTIPVLRGLPLFPRLKMVRVSLDTILGRFGTDIAPEISLADSLPPNLERLKLEFTWGCCGNPGLKPATVEEADQRLLVLFEDFAAEVWRFPGLKEVRLCGKREALTCGDRVAEMFKEGGVRVGWESWPGPTYDLLMQHQELEHELALWQE